MPSSRKPASTSNSSLMIAGARPREVRRAAVSSVSPSDRARSRAFAARRRRVNPARLVRRRSIIGNRFSMASTSAAAKSRRACAPDADVVLHGQLRKHLPALGHQRQTRTRHLVRGEAHHFPAEQQDLAVDRSQQSRYRTHQSRFARAVRAEYGDQFAGMHLQTSRGSTRARRCSPLPAGSRQARHRVAPPSRSRADAAETRLRRGRP